MCQKPGWGVYRPQHPAFRVNRIITRMLVCRQTLTPANIYLASSCIFRAMSPVTASWRCGAKCQTDMMDGLMLPSSLKRLQTVSLIYILASARRVSPSFQRQIPWTQKVWSWKPALHFALWLPESLVLLCVSPWSPSCSHYKPGTAAHCFWSDNLNLITPTELLTLCRSSAPRTGGGRI